MLTFWRHGYETTSISDLTAVMGITAPSLYTAFGDKKRLFLESVRLYAEAPEDLQIKLDQAPTARDAAQQMLNAAACAFTGATTPRGCLLASATASGSSDAAQVQAVVADIRRDIQRRLSLRIARDIGLGLVPGTTAADAVAGMVIAVIQGMSVLARDGMGRQNLVAVAQAAMAAWPRETGG